jgi:HAD superfamily hydrolase (TIGR01459 family)
VRHLRHLAPLMDGYDGLILDLWGVVHDGVRPYPDAPECLAALRAAGKRIVMLTNAPRRAEPIRAQLAGMGIGPALYDGVMSSGEASHDLLRDRPDDWSRALGRRVFHLGPARDRNVLAGLDVEVLDTPEGASCVLNTGPDDHAPPTDAAFFDPVLRDCAARRLPMICANPDLEVIRGGVRVICAGTLAERYAALGGDVRSLGKPDPLIYGPVIDMLAVPRARILAVGDALRTDMAGAKAAGVDGCWVLGGLHGEHLGEDRARIEAEAAASGLSPVATLPRLVW